MTRIALPALIVVVVAGAEACLFALYTLGYGAR